MHRASASLILAAKQLEVDNDIDYDYKLLLVKRTAHTAYALNHCVFPGGVFDKAADEASAWIVYMRAFGITEEQLEALTPQHASAKSNRPQLLTGGAEFSRDISLRLTAIRETFEEVGLLLCREQQSLKNLHPGQQAHVKCFPENFDKSFWQNVVHDNAQQFLGMCQLLQVVPDLWGLSEWSVWRSPATSHKKYETVYYFAAIHTTTLELQIEPSEVDDTYWLTPAECLKQNACEKIWLHFSLGYDISRIHHVHRLHMLTEFAHRRSKFGTTAMTLAFLRCDDCVIGTLPGDDLYPANPDVQLETIVLRGKYKDLRSFSKNIHRIIINGMHDTVIECNIAPLDGQLPAVGVPLSKL